MVFVLDKSIKRSIRKEIFYLGTIVGCNKKPSISMVSYCRNSSSLPLCAILHFVLSFLLMERIRKITRLMLLTRLRIQTSLPSLVPLLSSRFLGFRIVVKGGIKRPLYRRSLDTLLHRYFFPWLLGRNSKTQGNHEEWDVFSLFLFCQEILEVSRREKRMTVHSCIFTLKLGDKT